MGPFFEEYLVPGAKAFVPRRWPTADEAVERSTTPAASPWWRIPTGTSRTRPRSRS